MVQMHRGPAIYGGIQIDTFCFIYSLGYDSGLSSLIGALICVIDFPISFLLDTALLPWSITKALLSDQPIEVVPDFQ